MAEGKDQQGEEAVARASLRSISNAKNQTLGKRGALPRLEPGQNQGITSPSLSHLGPTCSLLVHLPGFRAGAPAPGEPEFLDRQVSSLPPSQPQA